MANWREERISYLSLKTELDDRKQEVLCSSHYQGILCQNANHFFQSTVWQLKLPQAILCSQGIKTWNMRIGCANYTHHSQSHQSMRHERQKRMVWEYFQWDNLSFLKPRIKQLFCAQCSSRYSISCDACWKIPILF